MTRPVDRRTLLRLLGIGAASAAGVRALGPTPAAAGGGRPPNVLFVSIDDLNDWAGVLGGHPQALTPNIDRLARSGVCFTNAHCAAPNCNASRVSTLTGLAPTTTGIYDNDQHGWRDALPGVVTLPEHFRHHGYRTFGSGKIFHTGDRASWDTYTPSRCRQRPAGSRSSSPAVRPANGLDMGMFDWAPVDTADERTSDGRVADVCVDALEQDQPDPFFLACGFFRPHQPWYAPAAYFDLYPLDEIVLPTQLAGDLGDVPVAGRRMARRRDHDAVVGAGQWAEAVQGYLASLTFADAQLGRVLDALDRSRHAQDTVVVLWSDHGWSLGEKFHWRKFALWEEATRIPLVVRAPGVSVAGTRPRNPASLLDLFPTLVDLCGLDPPDGPDGLDGTSLVPRLGGAEPANRYVVTTHGFGNHAVRSRRFRYIRYADGSEELYDHRRDPDEWVNRAGDPALDAVRRRHVRRLPGAEAPRADDGVNPCEA